MSHTSSTSSHDRLFELLADEATVGLDAAQKAELEALCAEHRDVDRECFQRAAAELDVALFGSERSSRFEAMPESVRARISMPSSMNAERSLNQGRGYSFAEAKPRRASVLPWLAAAAALALAVVGWWPKGGGSVPAPGATAFGQARLAGPADLERLRSTAGDVVKVKFDRGTDATGKACDGELYWSPSRQEGFMVFNGLAANDPKREQYQLWIFDPERDERHPVHGGVFDIPAGTGPAIVKIEPRLGVPKANLFVVTVERPGGVWVSDRSRIPALAKISG